MLKSIETALPSGSNRQAKVRACRPTSSSCCSRAAGRQGRGPRAARFIWCKGKMLHTRNRHLRNHRGFPWQFPTEFHFSALFSKGLSLVQWIFTGICHWFFSGILTIDFHVCEIWCVIVCPDGGRPQELAQTSQSPPPAGNATATHAKRIPRGYYMDLADSRAAKRS